MLSVICNMDFTNGTLLEIMRVMLEPEEDVAPKLLLLMSTMSKGLR